MTALGRIGFGLVLLLWVFSGSAGPAAARTDQLQVSLDAQRWFSALDRPLFDSGRRWVPGDTETVIVWARNTSTDLARLTVRVVDQNAGSRLDDELQLSVAVNGRPLDTAPGAAGYPVDPGAPVRVDITVAFPASAGNVSQRQRTDFSLRLTLTQLVDDPAGPEPGPGPGDPALPNTGASALAAALLVVGPLLTATGAALLGARRRPHSTRGARR